MINENIDYENLTEEKKNQIKEIILKKRAEHLQAVHKYYEKNKETIKKEKREYYMSKKREEYIAKLNILGETVSKKLMEKYEITFDESKGRYI